MTTRHSLAHTSLHKVSLEEMGEYFLDHSANIPEEGLVKISPASITPYVKNANLDVRTTDIKE